MKLKGINPIERNIEKIVLGVVFVVLLGALAMQFLVQPNRVDVGGGRTIPPQDIYTELAGEANRLKGKIEDQSPELPSVPETDLQDRYVAGRGANASGVDRLAVVTPSGVDVLSDVDIDPASAVAPGGPVAAPRVPAPRDAIAYAQWGTVDPFSLEEREGLASRVSSAQPYDLASVSVEAVFSGVELGEMLSSGDEALRPIPGAWRRDVEVVEVELERQRLLPDGRWGASEAATPIPSDVDIFEGVELADADLSKLLDVASQAGRDRAVVLQPRSAGLIAGPVWERPSRAKEIEAELAEPGSLPRLQMELARAEQELEDLENRKASQSGRPSGQTAPASRGETGGGRPRSTGGNRPGSGRQAQRGAGIDNRIREAQDAIRELEDRISDAEREIEDQREASDDALELPLFEQDEIRIWDHDMGVEPGATYRYRIRAVINNPLYKKESQLDESDDQQQSLAREPLVHGAWSDWTAPISVGGLTQYFVTNASSESRLGRSGAQATFEVFHMYYGHYRSDRALLEPGDPVSVRVGVPEGFVLFDEELVDSEGMRRYISSQEPYGEETPEGIEWAPTELDVNVPAYLLDVSELPLTQANALGVQDTISQVVIRTADGRLEVRRPSQDQAAQAYSSARGSAAAGQVMDLRLPEESRATRRGGPRVGGGRQIFGGPGEVRTKEGP